MANARSYLDSASGILFERALVQASKVMIKPSRFNDQTRISALTYTQVDQEKGTVRGVRQLPGFTIASVYSIYVEENRCCFKPSISRGINHHRWMSEISLNRSTMSLRPSYNGWPVKSFIEQCLYRLIIPPWIEESGSRALRSFNLPISLGVQRLRDHPGRRILIELQPPVLDPPRERESSVPSRHPVEFRSFESSRGTKS